MIEVPSEWHGAGYGFLCAVRCGERVTLHKHNRNREVTNTKAHSFTLTEFVNLDPGDFTEAAVISSSTGEVVGYFPIQTGETQAAPTRPVPIANNLQSAVPIDKAESHISSAPSGTVLAAHTDAGAGARFTCLRYDQTIGKLFYLDSHGTLQKHTAASGANGTAHIVSCTSIDDLEEAFRRAKATDIFVGGLPPSNGIEVTSKAKRSEGKIARSKDDFVFCAAPGVMFIDNDHPVASGDNQFDVYASVVPALASASYVYAPSSSAFIVNAETGEILKGAGGQHYAIPVQDASDIPRALEVLHQRMVLAGCGKAIVSDAGTALIRSPVDKALKTPNQPLFQRVSLAPGLVQHKEVHMGSHQGESFLFDTRLIPDLNHDELAQLAAIEQKLREGVADEVDDVRGAWVEARVQKVAESNSVEREVAAQYLRVILTRGATTSRYDLIPGNQIRFDNELVDVAELLANPGKYDCKPCADPLEPDYGSGVGVAKFYANAKTGKPTINSNAHGSQLFFLHHDPKAIDLSCILNQGAKKHTDPGPPVADAEKVAGFWEAKAAEYIAEKYKDAKYTLKSISEVELWKPTTPVVPEHLKSFPVTQLNKYLYWLNRCAEDTVNSISVASVIHLAAVAVARGARTNMNNHASLFMLLIAPTGFGKNYGKNAIVRLLHAADVAPTVSGEFHSKGGVYSAMLASPTVIFHLDEFGDKVKLGIKDGSPLSGAFSYSKEVYSMCGSVMPAPSYSTVGLSKANASAIRPIKYPCVNFYCLTTPGQLWEAIDNASVEGGFLNRFVGVVAASGGVNTNETPEFDPPEDLVSHIREVRGHLAGAGNLGEQKFTNSDIDPALTEYPFDSESRRLLSEFKLEILHACKTDEFMTNMTTRLRENAMRMALALHVFSKPTQRMIDAPVTQWCIDFVRFYGWQFAKAVLEHSQPKSEYGRLRRDFLLAFRSKPDGTTPSDLGRYGPWKNVRAQLRSEIIDDLKDAGLLAEVAKPTKGQRGPQGKVYVALAES